MSKKRPLSAEQTAECQAAHRLYLERRNELNLSQKKIADEAGISAPAVNLYFKGVNALNVSFALVLSRMLRVPVEAFSPRLAAEIDDITGATRKGDLQPERREVADRVAPYLAQDSSPELRRLHRIAAELTDDQLKLLCGIAELIRKG